MPIQPVKGLPVSGEARNTKVVIVLMAAMTFGALILLSLEALQPRVPVWSADTLLMAERGEPVESVLIEFVPPDAAGSLADFDCVVYPDGHCDWRPYGRHIRLAVAGAGGRRLAEAQARSVLAALGMMNQARGLDLARVRFGSDFAVFDRASVPAEARDLMALLARKGIAR